MSMIKKVTLTINKNNNAVRLSSPLKFYKNDSLLLYFEVEKYNFELREYVRVVPLSAIVFVETPDGQDTIETSIMDGNVIMFSLTSNHTRHVGTSRLQLVIRDNDGCQSATPPFEFSVEGLINDAILLVDEDGNIIVSEDSVPMTVTGSNGYNSINDLEEAEAINEESYLLITEEDKSYKARASLLKSNGSSISEEQYNELLQKYEELANRVAILEEQEV